MSETIEGNQVPAQWDEQLAKYAKKTQEAIKPAIVNMSVRAGNLMVDGVQMPGNELDCVIVAFSHENQYYDPTLRFDPNNLQNPICFAQSLDGKDMAPSPASTQPQALSCEACPQAQWKSADGGRGKGKACKQKVKLALIPLASLAGIDDLKKASVGMLSLPVTSVKNFREYVGYLAAEHKIMVPFLALTTIKSSSHPKLQIVVEFAFKAEIDKKFAGTLMDQIPKCEALLTTPYEDKPDDPTKPASQNKNKNTKY